MGQPMSVVGSTAGPPDRTVNRRAVRRTGFVPVEAKLQPPAAPPGSVVRGELVDRLLEDPQARVVVMSAPAGYGKSVVASQWAEQWGRHLAASPGRVVWLTLDDGDNDALVLLTYMCLALHRVEPVDAGVLAALGGRAPSVATILRRLDTVLGAREPFLFVLDDVHLLHDPQAVEVVARVARHLPSGGQLALVGRAAPPVTAVPAGCPVLRVGTDDLRLSRAEALGLVRATGIDLAPGDVEQVLAKAEGWPAGTYLAALSLAAADRGDVPVDAVTGSDSLIAAYLRDELIAALPPADQTFLLRTSVLHTMTGSLCDAVLSTNGSADVLRRLARGNVLLARVPRDAVDAGPASTQWFRLHRLLGEALRAELQRREPAMVPVLHARASRWLEDDGQLEAAVEHGIEAQETERVARLIWQATPGCLAAGRVATVEGWLDRFTPPQVAGHAKLSLTAAWCALHRGRSADHWVAGAERGHYEAARKGEAESVAAAVALLHAVAARHGVTQMAADAALSLRLQDPDDPWTVPAHVLAAVADVLAGHVAEARNGLGALQRLAQVHESHPAAALALAQQALLELAEQDWPAAQRTTARARATMSEHGLDDAPGLLLVPCLEALLAAQAERPDEARALVRRCVARLAPALLPAWLSVQCRLVLARADLILGDPPAARTALSDAQAQLAQLPDAVGLREAVQQTWRRLERVPLDTVAGPSTLTSAELRVLQLLPTHLSFEEIGRQLFVSRNTVKTQAVSAYRKLGATSRSEAVDRAHALGLIPIG